MQKLIEVTEEGLAALLGKEVLLMCSNYFYMGRLEGVNTSTVLLINPSIVYETGAWTDPNYKDVQKLHTNKWYVQISAIESFGEA